MQVMGYGSHHHTYPKSVLGEAPKNDEGMNPRTQQRTADWYLDVGEVACSLE